MIQAARSRQDPRRAGAPASLATATEPDAVRVLVIDDDEESSEVLAALLGLQGYDIRTAANGQDGLHLADVFRPHCAVIDLGLPDIDGLEVARRLRGSPGGDGVLLIAATGHRSQERGGHARAAGFDHHLGKPIDFELLCGLLPPSPAAAP